jgi:hypothetical protein
MLVCANEQRHAEEYGADQAPARELLDTDDGSGEEFPQCHLADGQRDERSKSGQGHEAEHAFEKSPDTVHAYITGVRPPAS